MPSASEILAVAAGGAIGGAVRHLALRFLMHRAIAASTALSVLNLLGCLFAGVAAARLPADDAWLRTVVFGGLLGGFTTFSAVSLEAALVFQGPAQRRVIWESGLAVVLAAPVVRLGMILGGGVP